MEVSRRALFTRGFKELINYFKISGSKERGDEGADYFSSFENCHALLAEAGDLLWEEAKNRGISIVGKSREEIARELFSQVQETILRKK